MYVCSGKSKGARNVCALSVHFFLIHAVFWNRQNYRFVPPTFEVDGPLGIRHWSGVCVCVCVCVRVCNFSLSVRHSFSETFEKLFLTECTSTLFEAYKNLTCTPTKACYVNGCMSSLCEVSSNTTQHLNKSNQWTSSIECMGVFKGPISLGQEN